MKRKHDKTRVIGKQRLPKLPKQNKNKITYSNKPIAKLTLAKYTSLFDKGKANTVLPIYFDTFNKDSGNTLFALDKRLENLQVAKNSIHNPTKVVVFCMRYSNSKLDVAKEVLEQVRKEYNFYEVLCETDL